ncbi:MAG: carboxypeptidase-like regulatory domain-containing protein, partial [Candidatus Latescibacterota bacterium]
MFNSYTKGMGAAALFLIFVLLSGSNVRAQAGSISGAVLRAEDGAALAYANVMLPGTVYGAMSMSDGSFAIVGLPPGSYTVKVMMMGYGVAEERGVVVEAGRDTYIELYLDETIVSSADTIRVTYTPPMVDVGEPTIIYKKPKEEFINLPIDRVQDVIGLVPGLVTVGDELHSRGGRTNEV